MLMNFNVNRLKRYTGIQELFSIHLKGSRKGLRPVPRKPHINPQLSFKLCTKSQKKKMNRVFFLTVQIKCSAS